MNGSFAVTMHVPVDKITNFMVERGYTRIDADVDLIMSLLDKTPVTFEHDGVSYSVAYVAALDAYDVDQASALSQADYDLTDAVNAAVRS